MRKVLESTQMYLVMGLLFLFHCPISIMVMADLLLDVRCFDQVGCSFY